MYIPEEEWYCHKDGKNPNRQKTTISGDFAISINR